MSGIGKREMRYSASDGSDACMLCLYLCIDRFFRFDFRKGFMRCDLKRAFAFYRV